MNKTDEGRPEKSEPDRAEHPTLFGPPPLFDGEDTEIYDHLVREISTAVTPADIFENIWVRDFVDLTFEVFRLRRLTANLIKANAYKGLSETLAPLVGWSQAETLAEGWAARKPEVVEEVNKTLTSAGLTTDNILAQTFSLKLNDIERVQHMIALAELAATLLYVKSTGIGKRSVRNCGGPRSNLRMANFGSSSTRHRLMRQTWCD